MFRKLRSKFDEPYRIRHGWGLSPLRNQRELKALIWFCENELKDKEYMRLNPERRNIFTNTVKMYKTNDANLYFFIVDNAGWYWN